MAVCLMEGGGKREGRVGGKVRKSNIARWE